jgi:para-nitrobenzyl esterase
LAGGCRIIIDEIPEALAAIRTIANLLSEILKMRRVALTAMCFSLCSTSLGALDVTIQTSVGLVRGSGTDIKAFKGIPFAAPPVGRLRWRPPEKPKAWHGIRDATTFGAACPQTGLPATLPFSEDCLTLNIWTPARAPGDRLPVFVWAHGGGGVFGAGADPSWDGEALARRGVVVVTLNYRLGALGLLAHPTLSRESRKGVSGNYALLDLIEALRWVRSNIARFGGDPEHVTFGGQSQGALSAGLLMMSPLAHGLFQRAILESLPRLMGPFPYLKESRYGYPSQEQAAARLVPDLRVLRDAPAASLVAQLPTRSYFGTGLSHQPVVDGWVIPADPRERLGTPAQLKIPVLIGLTADEESFFGRFGPPKTVAAYREWLGREFPAFADRIFARYPAATDAEAASAAQRAFADSVLKAPTFLTARALARVNTTYLYLFSRVSPLTRRQSGGAAHTAETPYVFDHITVKPGDWEERDVAISRAMSDAWVQFIKTGNPNGNGLTRWPAYAPSSEELLEFGDELSIKSHVDADDVAFWSELFERMYKADSAHVTPTRQNSK